MNKLLLVIGASTALILATGCTPNGGQGSARPSTTGSSSTSPSATTPAAPPATTADPSPSASASAGTPDPAPAPAPTSDSPLSSIDLNTRGNESQQVGQAGIFGAATGEKYATLTATKIQTNFKCTEPSAFPSINGQFVALTIDVTTSSNFAESGWPSLAITSNEFRGWDSAGKKLLDPIGNSTGCVKSSELLESPIDPDKSQSGMIILDVPAGAGSAAFVVGGFEGSYGWEWHW
ncbi:hypothetical protein [Arthrobacter glacialis]|uniref:hypothetical protein n=1 Tax=Arthrobacter glacialis TaxID=1664 RepID=UPI0010572D6B|nr:hypothetical protein [Arthrobacter glacialis]